MDIATLGYSVDSSGLERGTRALDDHTKAAERTAGATETLESRYRDVARRGMEYADVMRTGNLSERAMAEAAREAAQGIDTKAQVMARAGTVQDRMVQRVEAMRLAEEREAKVAAESARQKALQELNLRRLTDQIDPTIARLNRLGELEGTLEKALDMGAITPEVFDHYQGKLDMTRAATLKAGQASDIMTRSIGGLNLQTIETQQSIAALGRALLTGQWGQAQSSITSLTARTGVMSGVMTAAGVAIGTTAAGVGIYASALHQAEKDTSRITNALAMTGNYAGVTAGQIDGLIDSMAALEGVTHGGARNALIAVAESGRIAGDQFEMVASIAARMEAAAVQSLDVTIGKFAEIGRDPVAALLKLNDTEHFLTQTHLDRIDALIDQGREQDAAAEAARIYAERLDQVATAAELGLPHLTQMTNQVREMSSAAWQGAQNFAEFLAAAVKVYRQRPLNQQLGFTGAFNFMRDLGRAEPIAPPGVPPVPNALAPSAAEARLAAEEAATREIQRQLDAVNGLDTGVNKLERSFAALSREQQLAMMANGDYMRLLNRAMEEDEKRAAAGQRRARVAKERISEEDRLQQQMLSRFENQNESMARQITLYGDTSRAAAVAFDIQKSGLRDINGELAKSIESQAAWLDWLDDMAALDDVRAGIAQEHKEVMERNKGEAEEMSEYALQAARNMQNHFANFLFDPFAAGTKSMGDQFSETLRRMMAEAAASKMFEMLGGAMAGYTGTGASWVNMIGGVLGGTVGKKGKGREYGGPVYNGSFYRVGERNKPELLTTANGQYLLPGENGRVEPIRAAPVQRPPASAGGVWKIELVNNGPASQVQGSTITQQPDGSQLLRVFIGAVSEDIASGGSTLAAIKSRLDVRERV